jgi:hypothetical protein
MHPSGSMVKVALPQTVLGASFVREIAAWPMTIPSGTILDGRGRSPPLGRKK